MWVHVMDTLADCEHLRLFPMSCSQGDACIARSTHGRLREAHRHWHDAVHRYHDLDGLRTYLNGTVQALRNVTFTLQSTKSGVEGFDGWYDPWRQSFKDDSIMRWAVDSRNRVVKDADLETDSVARVTLVGSADGIPMIEVAADPTESDQKLAALLAVRVPATHAMTQGGMLRVERRWIDRAQPEMEVLDAAAYVFSRLAGLLFDFHCHIDRREECGWRAGALTDANANPRDRVLTPPCMLAYDTFRTSWVRLSNGERVELATRPLEGNAAIDAAARDRYGNLGHEHLRRAVFAKSLRDRAWGFWEAARQLMEHDGWHAHIAWLFNGDGLIQQHALWLSDNATKHLIWDELRRHVVRTGATVVIVVGEKWKGSFDPAEPDRRAEDSPHRQEMLGVDAVNAEGAVLSLLGHVKRVDGKTVVEPPMEFTDTRINYLDEVRSAWGL